MAKISDVLRLAGTEPPRNDRDLIRCPLPGHFDGTPSFKSVEDRGYCCFGCDHRGGALDLCVLLDLARSRSDAVDVLGEFYRIPRGDGATGGRRGSTSQRRALAAFSYAPAAEKDEERSAEDAEDLRLALLGSAPLEGTLGAEYLESRGLDPVRCTENGVTYHPNWLNLGPAVLFAVLDSAGKPVAAHGRYLFPPSDDRKSRTKGALRLGCYWTAGALDARIVAITEAPIDALSLASVGLPAIALCGLRTRLPWLRQKLSMRDVVICTDSDDRGEEGAQQLRALLDLGTTCTRLTFPPDVKDTNEFFLRDRQALSVAVLEATGRSGQSEPGPELCLWRDGTMHAVDEAAVSCETCREHLADCICQPPPEADALIDVQARANEILQTRFGLQSPPDDEFDLAEAGLICTFQGRQEKGAFDFQTRRPSYEWTSLHRQADGFWSDSPGLDIAPVCKWESPTEAAVEADRDWHKKHVKSKAQPGIKLANELAHDKTCLWRANGTAAKVAGFCDECGAGQSGVKTRFHLATCPPKESQDDRAVPILSVAREADLRDLKRLDERAELTASLKQARVARFHSPAAQAAASSVSRVCA